MPATEHEDPVEPEQVLCPITLTMFRDPVKVASGFTYEREAILDWWSKQKRLLDPRTNQICPSDAMCPDWDMRIAVGKFLEEHPSYVPRGWDDRKLPAPLPACPATRTGTYRKVHAAVFRHPAFAQTELCVLVCLGVAYIVVFSIIVCRSQSSSQGPFSARHQLRLLGELALSSQARDTLQQQGELNVWLAFIRADIKSAETQQLGCRLMANFALDKQRASLITSWGGTDLAMEAMKRHPQSVHVQRECSYALRTLSSQESSVEVLLTAMEKHPTSPDVQTNCAEALANLADINATSVAAMGLFGIQRVVGIIEGHPKSPELQSTSLRLLKALVRGAVKETAVSTKAIKLVLEAMEKNPSSATVQESCTLALTTLAAGNPALAGPRGILLVLNAIERHPASAKLQSACARALTELAANNAVHVTRALSNGGLEVLERAMQKYPQSLSAQVCKALGLLIPAAISPHVTRSASLGQAVNNAVKKYPNSDKIQLECGYALKFVS